jgi:hypothetical protein
MTGKQHLVDQSGFTVVDMGNYGNVPDGLLLHKCGKIKSARESSGFFAYICKKKLSAH